MEAPIFSIVAQIVMEVLEDNVIHGPDFYSHNHEKIENNNLI